MRRKPSLAAPPEDQAIPLALPRVTGTGVETRWGRLIVPLHVTARDIANLEQQLPLALNILRAQLETGTKRDDEGERSL